MALVNLNCPNCNGKTEVDDSREFATCMYCNSKMFINSASRSYPAPPPPMPYTPAAPAVPVVKKKKRGGLIAIIIGIIIFIAIIVPKEGGNDERVIRSQDFISAGQKAGYTMIIEDDYDGFGTYWAGAHKFAEGVVQKEGNEIYVIDYTRDKTIHNSKIEYQLYVDKVKEMGGKSNSNSGSNYEFQVNSSDKRFGIAYRIGDVNLYVVADAEYKDEIMAFFDAIGFGVEI